MTRFDCEHLAKRIVQHYTTVANYEKALTVIHFLAEKVPRRTIYNIIQKYDVSGTIGDKPRSGRPKKMPSGQRRRLKRLVNDRAGVSVRKVASKFGVHRRTIQWELKDMNIVYRKKKRAPCYAEKQLAEVPTCARRLYRMFLKEHFDLIMDDEKYFSLTKDSVSKNRGFYTSDPNSTPANVKFKRTQKYSILEPFFAKQRQAINETTYPNCCIRRHLMPFINQHHNSSNILFWPDLTSSHYASSVTQFLGNKNIHLIAKEKILRTVPKHCLWKHSRKF